MIYFRNQTSLLRKEQENEIGAGTHVADDHADYGVENCSIIDDIITHDFVEGLNYDTIIEEFLLELCENFNVSTKANGHNVVIT